MARNDVYLNINSLSPADAVVTGQQDMTAATIPELVLGDTPTFNFYFTDNTNVWPSWAGNASYTLTWALSDAVAGDFAPAATTGNATPITGGWSVVLPLNSYDLVGLLNTKRVGQPYPVQNLWQQLRVTDPSGNEITRAMVWTPVRYRAISDTQNTESASPTGGRFVTVNNVNELTTPTDAQFYAANPVPTSALGTASNGQLFIGNGTGFTKATLTAGTGVAITNGSGSITIDATNAQELLTATVTNAEATPITKGQVVYIFGATGNRPSVKLAYNTGDATSAKTFGVVSDASIAAGGTGTVTCVGVVDGLNLGTYSDGDTVYLGATPGSITATKPYAPNHLVYVGIIERANAGNGELYVRIQNGYELDEIHDVQILTPPAAGSLLIRDNTLSLWKAATLTAGTNIAVTNGDAAVTVGLTGTVAVANGGTGVTTSTGTGSVVLSTSPSLTTPSLGVAMATSINSTTIPSSKTLVVTTDKLSALAATTSSELAGVISDETGTGALVFANTPTLVTPNIGAATGTSFNLTGSGTLGTTLTVSGTTDSSSKDTGAIVTEGGLGVEKSATIGGNLTVSGTGNSTFAGNLQVSGLIGHNSVAGDLDIYSGNGTGTEYAVNLYSRNSSNDAWIKALVAKGTSTTIAGNLTVSGGTGTIDATSGTASATLSLVGRSSGSARTASIVSNSSGSLVFSSEGAGNAMTLNASTGNLSVAYNLTVSGTGTSNVGGTPSTGLATYSGNLRLLSSVSGPAGVTGIELQNSQSGNGYGYKIYANYSSNDYLGIAGRFNSATWTEFIAIKQDTGNLLIGTTIDGGQKLQVAGTAAFSGDVSITATNARLNITPSTNTNGAGVTLTNTGTLGRLGISSSTGNTFFTGTGGNRAYAFQLGNRDSNYLQLFTNDIARLEIDGSGNVAVTTTTASTSTTTGALVVSGGVGVAGAMYVGGAIAVGNTVNTVSPTSPNRTITMVIGGTTYYIHAKTTND